MRQILRLTLVLFLFYSSDSLSQVETRYWQIGNDGLLSQQILSCKQNGNKEIVFLGKSEDSEKNGVFPTISRLDLKGNIVYSGLIEDPLIELRDFLIQPDQNYRIIGSYEVQGKPAPYVKIIDSVGQSSQSTAFLSSRIIMNNHILMLNDHSAVLSQAILGNNEKFNVQLIWMKTSEYWGQEQFLKISSDFDEENACLAKLPGSRLLVVNNRFVAGEVRFQQYYPVLYLIDENGENKFKFSIESYRNYDFLSCVSDNAGNIYLCLGKKEQEKALAKTIILKYKQDGTLIKSITFNDICASGILCLSDGNLLIFGANYVRNTLYLIMKGHVKLMTSNLEQIRFREMGMFDLPDADLPSLAMNALPTSSEFLCACQLYDGRICLAGRVFMPVDVSPEKIITSQRRNRNFMIIIPHTAEF